MNYPWAYPGAKIVCVSDDFDLSIAPDISKTPRKNGKYTIKQAHIGHDGIVFLSLAEIQGDYWDAEAFRPVISKDQDIALFTRIAQDASHRISEDV